MQPPRLRRSESFFGVHFDFHANADCTGIGGSLRPETLDKMLREIAPDYVQCDCKGHPGLSSYPTRVGHAAPGIIRDPLRTWHQVTARRGVGLYMHYSGVWDTAAITAHPDWARVDEKGKRDPNNTSVFGAYVDELLIPQLKELRDDYGVDGVWVDGECWATCQDYGKDVLAAFRRATGIRKIPRRPEDAHFIEFTEFCREGFRNYLRRYVDALHAHDRDFEIASNWAFTSFMPEPVSADVDFISGDYPLIDSVRAARLEARCMMRQGKPWDLMAWSFSSRWGERGASTKSVVQLQQEAAIVLALGGGFQVYCKQKRDGSIEEWPMKVVAEVARFCRARQTVCHRAEAVPQIALLLSSASFYKSSKRLFGPWTSKINSEDGIYDALRGTLDALLDGQHAVEVLIEHQLVGRMDDYPLIVVPEWSYLEPTFRDALIGYVRRGGNLLVIGVAAARMFENELGVELPAEPETRARYLEHKGQLAGLFSPGIEPKLKAGTRAFTRWQERNDFAPRPGVASTVRKLGKGQIGGLYLDLGKRYTKARTAILRDVLSANVARLFPEPMVTVTGSHSIDVSVMRQAGLLCINLVNTSGPHADENVYTFDEIPPLGPIQVAVQLPARPRAVTIVPSGAKLPFTWKTQKLHFTMDRLEIHAAVQID
jgi:hypothetical protein